MTDKMQLPAPVPPATRIIFWRNAALVLSATLALFACGDDGEPDVRQPHAVRVASFQVKSATEAGADDLTNPHLTRGSSFRVDLYEVPEFPCVRTDSDDFLHIPESTQTPGAAAVFFAVPPRDTGAPVLIMFHGNGLDFIEALASLFVHAAPQTAELLLRAQPDFAGFIEILNRGGAMRGLRGELSGAVAAAALERGWGIVVPGNCWGDGGHHRGEVIDYYIRAPRFGRSMDDFVWHWYRSHFPHDSRREYSFGCSGGGQRTAQLLLADPDAVAAAAIDSPADYLPGFRDDPPGLFSLLRDIPGYLDVLESFYLAHYGSWEHAAAQSLGTQLLPRDIATPIYLAYSVNDPLVTNGITRFLAGALAERTPSERQVVWNTGEPAHCQINSRERAETVLDWLAQWQR